jgi:hypothetical protein
VIFSRSRGGSGRRQKAEQSRQEARHAARRRTRDEFGFDDDEADDGGAGGGPAEGPFDITEAPDAVDRLDLGSLQIPAVAGVEFRVQADAEGQIQQIVLVHGESALQLGVFAAPRSEGIWDEVREDIRKQLSADGMAAEEVDGDYGVELRSRVRTPEGSTDLRFVGVDGPRWMVRGVYQGPAAADPAAAGPLAECLRGLVVDRGVEAMPVREPLPLRLPREMAEQARAGAAADAVAEGKRVNGAAAPSRPRPSQRPRRKG